MDCFTENWVPIAKTKLSVTAIGGEFVERSYNVKEPAGRNMWLFIPSKDTKRSPAVPLVSLKTLALVVKGVPKATKDPVILPNAKVLNVSKRATAMINPVVKGRKV